MTVGKEVTYLNNADACYEFEVGRNNADEEEDLKHVATVICESWRNVDTSKVTMDVVRGGITNRLFKLSCEGHKSVLVRLYGENTEAFINRTEENQLFAQLSKEGFAPTFYGRFLNGRVEGWLDARPLEPQEMGQTAPVNFVKLIGKELARMHNLDIPRDRTSVLWSKVDRFEQLATEIAFPGNASKQRELDALDLPTVRKNLQWLKTVLPSALNRDGLDLPSPDAMTAQASQFASDVVFSHNDLLSGNMLFHDFWDRVQILDYEYGGYNYRAFDFANHFCEYCGFEMDLSMYPSRAKQIMLFRSYMAVAAPDQLAALEANHEAEAFFDAFYDVVNRFALASHLFWGYWAVVQAAHSKIDFDFLLYAQKRFTTFNQHRALFFKEE